MTDGRPYVLVLDPVVSTRETLVGQLKEGGFDAAGVGSSAECLGELKRRLPDLVILDITDPAFDALALTGQVSSAHSDLPLLVLYAQEREPAVTAFLAAGATDFMCTPIRDPSLLARLAQRNILLGSNLARVAEKEVELEALNRTLVENLRILERDQHAGFRVQESLMPQTPYTVGRITFAHYLQPSLILSGDFVDYFELQDGRLLFFLADVSGHGASSAFVTVLLKSLSRRLLREFDSLGFTGTASMLDWFNRELLACELEQHSTMFLGLFDRDCESLQYSNAAHFPATILSSAESTDYLEIGGLPLGLYKGASYTESTALLPDQCSLVLFSDGVFEIMSEQTLKLKEEALLALVRCGSRDIDALIETLGLEDVKNAPDDIALFTVAKAG